MDRSVWGRRAASALAAVGVAGCGAGVTDVAPPAQSPSQAQAPYEVRRPAPVATPAADTPEVSGDTDRDKAYARFLQDHAAGMIKKAAVGIEKRGELRIEVSRAVEPEDTLPLTKSLMAGARKDFPDRPITLSLYDPQGAPILKARFTPGEGVHYQIAHGGGGGSAGGNTGTAPERAAERPATTTKGNDPIARGGVTERDQKFSAWAEEHGRSMLRYVESDLERHGRLWFGVTRDVKPEDVRPLTKSLLEGAHKEFPRGGLVATVFDPDGEKIGRARLVGDGDVEWEK